jgi:hypothetical protein
MRLNIDIFLLGNKKQACSCPMIPFCIIIKEIDQKSNKNCRSKSHFTAGNWVQNYLKLNPIQSICQRCPVMFCVIGRKYVKHLTCMERCVQYHAFNYISAVLNKIFCIGDLCTSRRMLRSGSQCKAHI